jgi:hypothetical protein
MIPRFFSLLVFFSLLPGASQAQSEADSEARPIQHYDVEIIIFKNLRVPRSKEFVLPVSSPSKNENMFDLSSQASVDSALESGYEMLAADEFRLLEVVTRLIQSTRYQLLLHAAWRQPGVDLEQVMPVWIKGGRIFGNEYISIDSQIEHFDNNGQTDELAEGEAKTYQFDEQTLESQRLQILEEQTLEKKSLEEKGLANHDGLYELEGKITIALSRYLHTYIDLILRRPRLSADSVLDNPAQAEYLAAHAADTRILNNHLLREHRRMRSKNLHYIDSPEFAMLVLITPYEVAEEFVEEPIEPDAEVEPTVVE